MKGEQMNPQLINDILYYFIVGVEIILGLSGIGFLILWVLSDQTLNVERKRKAGIYLFISIGLFYVIRFGSIALFSFLYSKGMSTSLQSVTINILRLFQLIIIAFVPAFSMLQASIFKYQSLITERPESKKRLTFYRSIGIFATAAIILLLQLMINLL